MLDLKEIEYDSIEREGNKIVYACYLSGKELNKYELGILEDLLCSQAI